MFSKKQGVIKITKTTYCISFNYVTKIRGKFSRTYLIIAFY